MKRRQGDRSITRSEGLRPRIGGDDTRTREGKGRLGSNKGVGRQGL
jgi:hypothetical protein